MDKVTVTEASALASQICGCANNPQHAKDIATLLEYRHAAMLEGVRLGLEAAEKAVQAAQHDPAPWCKAREIMRNMDPAAIVEGVK